MSTNRGYGRRAFVALLFLIAASAFGQQPGVIKDIQIKGLQNVNREQLLAVMRSKVGQPFLQSQLDQDKLSIEDLGYFQAVDVRAREIETQSYEVLVEVTEFAKVKEIRVVGNSVVETAAILKVLEASGIAPGNVYNLRSQTSASQGVTKLYSEKGFFAQISEFGPLPESPETVSVTIAELTVNSVGIQGNTRTKAYVFERMMKTKAGHAFNQMLWQDDMRRLYNTQWFEKIEPVARPTEELGKVDLIVDVKEARTGQFNIGLQIDPRNSLAGLVRFSDSNFRGTGQSVGLSVVQGSAGGGTSIDLDYGNPFFDNRDTSVNVSVYSRIVYRFVGSGFGGSSSPTEDSRYFERRTGGTFSLTRRVRRDMALSVGLRGEEIKTNELDTKSTTGFIQQDGTVASFSVGAILNRRDVDIDPSTGSWLRATVEPGYADIKKVGGEIPDESLLGGHTFFRSGIEYRHYVSAQGPRKKLDDLRRTLAFRAKYGYISGTVPFFEQFFIGGSDTLRGHNEDRFWGKEFALLTLEYRHPVQKAFNLIAFVDYGSAWGGYGTVGGFEQTKRPDFQVGYGLGFSFRSPLGPIRLDFAFNKDGKSRTHFLIGTSF